MTSPVPRWAAIIINYNAGDLLLACVASVLADDSAGTPHVVISDNASVDTSLDDVRAKFPEVTILENGANLGYSAAANRGIAVTDAPIVAILNPDLVVAPGTAAAMCGALDADPNVAAVGPMVLDPSGSVYPSARRHPGLATAIGHASLSRVAPNNRWTRRYRDTDVDPTEPRDVDWLSGAAMWLRRPTLDAVGGWDEGYFMYVEDVDLCWRLRRAGSTVRFVPAGSVIHVQGATTAKRPYRMIVVHHQSWYRFTAKRWTGARRILLPAVAAFLAVRAGLACAARAVRPPARARTQLADDAR